MKQWRKNAPFLLFLLFLAAVLYALKFERGETPQERAKKLGTLLDFQANKVTRIQLVGQKGPITLEKKEGKWRIVEPIQAEADQEEVERLLKDWQDRQTTRIIPGKEVEDWGRFGLKEPKHQLTLVEEDGTQATLLIGDEAPDNAYFARVKGRDQLLKFSSWFIKDTILEKKLDDLRDKTLLAFEKGDVERLVLQHGEQGVECAREGGKWWLIRPRRAPADENEVDAILSGLRDAKIEEFVEDRPADLAPYGLDKPQASIVLALGAKGTQKLLIGKVKAEGSTSTSSSSGKVYVKREVEPAVYVVEQKVLDYAKKTPHDLRRKLVWDLQKDKVRQVLYTRQGRTVELKKREKPEAQETETWDLLQPQRIKADRQRVDDLLYALRDLTATAFIDPPADPAVYGLTTPQAEVRVWQEGEKEPRILQVGKVASDGSGLFVQPKGDPTIYKVRTTLLDDLVIDVNRLRDLLVLKFDRKDVERILVQTEKQEIEIRRRGESGWQVTKPERFEADAFKVGDILYRLEELRGDLFVAEGVRDPKQYGFDKPQVKVTVFLKGRRPTVVVVGKKDEATQKVYFQVEGQPGVYLKDSTLVDDLSPSLEALKKKSP